MHLCGQVMSKKNKKPDLKARLEHKLYLARENPEPIFDLSECGLKAVPQGVFSLCRVFLKEALLLGDNRLEDLRGGGILSDLKQITVLDLRKNDFHQLPDEIKALTNLRELYINDNHLKRLPESITLLSNLRVLDASNNALQKLPETFGNLAYLQSFSITGNKNLKKLPRSICGVHGLKHLALDADNFVYPPSDICRTGIDEIIKYVADDCGIPYVGPIQVEQEVSSPNKGDLCGLDMQLLQEKHFQLEKLKEQRRNELLRIERNNELLQRQEMQLHDAKRLNKQKLLTDLVREQNRFEDDLLRIHREKDVERQQLMQLLQDEECKSDSAINQLIEMCRIPQTQLLKQEAEDEARLFDAVNKYNDTLRRQEILERMQAILEEEAQQFESYNKNKAETTRTILSQEMEMGTGINRFLKLQDYQHANLVSKLQQDNELQKVAVGALLERGDARTWGLVQQVHLVSAQLARLTTLELDKRRLQLDEHLNDLSEKRINLSAVLLDLLSQQAERREQLLQTLQVLEDSESDRADDFWLIQYQRLLERRPDILDQTHRDLDTELLQGLLLAGVIHCVPFLAPWAHSPDAIGKITSTELAEAGVTRHDEREKILRAIENYLAFRSEGCDEKEPTAPSFEASAPIPPVGTTSVIGVAECVICMDNTCAVIFVPCGHMCTCMDCSKTVDLCPLCRAEIERKIQVIIP